MDGRASSLVVVGASAGGVEALREIASGLPADLPAAVGVVLHVSPTAESRLPEILSRAAPLDARHAWDGDPITPGSNRRRCP
jgi:two-component system, chemotaxis family, protein-glutamate methylesterase/glutaminase